MVFQNWRHSCTQKSPQWLQILLIILSNDVSRNPGPPFRNSFFNFMSWNVNSIAKDDVQRVYLIETHNSIFNYDLISICETSLNDSIKLSDILLNDYILLCIPNIQQTTRHGGVGLFYKNSLPIKTRNDLSFEESIVVELNFGRKKILFTVLYRSPTFNHTTPDGDTTVEGREIENLISSLNLSQLIFEPTNFEPNKNPSCIDLVKTDQPNLVLDSGTRVSLDSFCHHQITYCKVNFNIPTPPPFERKI